LNRMSLVLALASVLCTAIPVHSQVPPSASEQVQVGPPPVRRAEPPSASATAQELEKRGDALRGEKAYLDAMDYYRAAISKTPRSAQLLNKMGITELSMQRFKEAKKDFEKAIRLDRQFADAYNNLGVTEYLAKKYDRAIRQYEKAIGLNEASASYYSNLGAAYFSKKEWEKASLAYSQALRLDPDIFERTSRSGVIGQISSPQDRAHFEYVLAKLYAKQGLADRSLECLRRAMEEGYQRISDVYTDAEFGELRKDPRFAQLMAAKPSAIPE